MNVPDSRGHVSVEMEMNMTAPADTFLISWALQDNTIFSLIFACINRSYGSMLKHSLL